MAYVNYPTYLETRSRDFGAAPTQPVVVTKNQDDTAKTLLFLGVGLFLGYFLLKKDKDHHEKNPHEYVEIKSLPALLKAYSRKEDHSDKSMAAAIEEVRVKNPEDANKNAYGFMCFDEFKEAAKTDPLLEAMSDDEETLKAIHDSAVKGRVDMNGVVEKETDKEKNPSDLYGGGSSLVIIKKVAKNKYYGIFKKVEHQHKRGSIVTKKTYSVELLDNHDKPVTDPTNRFWITSLPKAKAYVKELKGAK